MAKDFKGIGQRAGLKPQEAKGFGGLIASPNQEEGPQEPNGKPATTLVYSPDDRKQESYQMLVRQSEKIRDYTHLQRIQGKTNYRYLDALDDLLDIAFAAVGEIPERPEEVKVQERKKGRKGSPGNKE